MGRTLPDISRNVDSYVARGNAFILKPSEKAPLAGTRLVELLAEAGLPAGVVGVVQGGQEVSEALIADPHVQAVSFVGSSAVAESVYRLAAAHGKRVQALGGAKNHLIVLADADLERSLPALIGSGFGCGGQRCLAGSALVVVGSRGEQDHMVSRFVAAARERVPSSSSSPRTRPCCRIS